MKWLEPAVLFKPTSYQCQTVRVPTPAEAVEFSPQALVCDTDFWTGCRVFSSRTVLVGPCKKIQPMKK